MPGSGKRPRNCKLFYFVAFAGPGWKMIGVCIFVNKTSHCQKEHTKNQFPYYPSPTLTKNHLVCLFVLESVVQGLPFLQWKPSVLPKKQLNVWTIENGTLPKERPKTASAKCFLEAVTKTNCFRIHLVRLLHASAFLIFKISANKVNFTSQKPFPDTKWKVNSTNMQI